MCQNPFGERRDLRPHALCQVRGVTGFRANEDTVALAFKHSAENALAFTVMIGIRGIEEIDPLLKRFEQSRVGLTRIAGYGGKPHTSERQHGWPKIGLSQLPIFHLSWLQR